MRRSCRLACLFLLVSVVSVPLGAQVSQSEYRQRRDALVARIDDGILFAIGGSEPAEDFLSFNQAPQFEYLTGFHEPDAALVIVKKGGTATSTIFVQPRSPANEVWTGTRLGVDGVSRITGLKGRDADELRPTLDSLASLGLPFYVVGNLGREGEGVATPDAQLIASLRAKHPTLAVRDARGLVLRQRGTKSAAELALIRKAVEITVAAQLEAMRAIEPGMNEFEIQALIEYTFRRRGADRPSFSTIVGSGPNSTTLHYNRDDRFIQDGDLIVMDIGASAKGYAADVTRTVPANGKFSPAQREVYQIVRDAQSAAERQAKVGAIAWRMTDSSTAVLATGLARLGLIESPTATYECNDGDTKDCPQYRLYYMHSIGHGIGLEVHDPDQYYFAPNVIAAGSAFTLEPGIYVRANTVDIIPDTPKNRAIRTKIAPAVAKYANIGVRIEDDYLVTEKGVEWVSRAPREIGEIEAAMRGPNDGPNKRDAALIQWYPKF